MYESLGESKQDPEICPLYHGICYRGVSAMRGSTVLDTALVLLNNTACCSI